MNNRFLYTHIIIFPSEGSKTDLMALYQYKKISLYRKNATVVLQVLQKILSLLTSGQEKDRSISAVLPRISQQSKGEGFITKSTTNTLETGSSPKRSSYLVRKATQWKEKHSFGHIFTKTSIG